MSTDPKSETRFVLPRDARPSARLPAMSEALRGGAAFEGASRRVAGGGAARLRQDGGRAAGEGPRPSGARGGGAGVAKFQELGTARQTLLWFLEHSLDLPVRGRGGKGIAWRRPNYAVVHRMLSHPNYGGAYVYGRTESAWGCEGERPRRGVRHRPRERWHALIPDAHEGYVSWERFERVRETLAANDQRGNGAGASKKGAALLAGLLRCRRCGRKLVVSHTGSRHDALRYCCHRGWMDNGEPRCVAFGGAPLDEAIAREVLRAVRLGALEAAAAAAEDAERRRDEAADALRRDLDAARYEADRTGCQHDAVDPANRLVADELEARWNRALARVAEI